MLDGIAHDSDEVLTGRRVEADERLMAAVLGAFEDAFDGGCRADTGDPLGEAANEIERRARWTTQDRVVAQARTNGRLQGITDVADWLRDNGHKDAAHIVALHGTEIWNMIYSRASRGD
jgi:hypothetical protein